MKAFTYIDRRINPHFREDQDRILKLWKDSFDRHGFETTTLTEDDSMRHPRYAELLELVRQFPSVCQRDYENACWLRWLAYEQNAPGLFTDWDVLNFALVPEAVPTGDVISLHADGGPGAVYATGVGIAGFISQFPDAPRRPWTVQGQTHTSDMTLFTSLGYPRVDLCAMITSPSARTAPLVHFHNERLPDGDRHHKRWQYMETFQHE